MPLQNLAYSEARNPNITHDDIASSSVYDLATNNKDDYITYAKFYSQSCGNTTVQECVVRFSALADKVSTDSTKENLAVVAGVTGAMLAPIAAPALLGPAATAGATITAAGNDAYIVCVTSQLCTGGLTSLAALDLGVALRDYYRGDPSSLGALVTAGSVNGMGDFAYDLVSLIRAGKVVAPITSRDHLIEQLIARGTKVSPEKILEIQVLKDGKIVWLETGGPDKGLEHIVAKHGTQFKDWGIEKDQIQELISQALIDQNLVGTSNGAPVYLVGNVPTAVAISENGYIVTAYPTSKFSRF